MAGPPGSPINEDTGGDALLRGSGLAFARASLRSTQRDQSCVTGLPAGMAVASSPLALFPAFLAARKRHYSPARPRTCHELRRHPSMPCPHRRLSYTGSPESSLCRATDCPGTLNGGSPALTQCGSSSEMWALGYARTGWTDEPGPNASVGTVSNTVRVQVTLGDTPFRIRSSGCAPAAHGETQSCMAHVRLQSLRWEIQTHRSLERERRRPAGHDRIRCSATLFRNTCRCEKPGGQRLFRTALIRVPREERVRVLCTSVRARVPCRTKKPPKVLIRTTQRCSIQPSSLASRGVFSLQGLSNDDAKMH